MPRLPPTEKLQPHIFLRRRSLSGVAVQQGTVFDSGPNYPRADASHCQGFGQERNDQEHSNRNGMASKRPITWRSINKTARKQRVAGRRGCGGRGWVFFPRHSQVKWTFPLQGFFIS
ncbi:unnamed protein product [Linum tenue]|uniref:Uncharacterized protein n=1 Tax=Linum tenue TaxID=586396 RepID=A0AAV0KI07_9ROSI|nr:unnamed protein product [Linum tenue]